MHDLVEIGLQVSSKFLERAGGSLHEAVKLQLGKGSLTPSRISGVSLVFRKIATLLYSNANVEMQNVRSCTDCF